jgi:hypothetical protein
MVKCWNKSATKDLNNLIAAGENNPNIVDAAYIGDVVSGEHFSEYEAPPPHQVAKQRLSAFVDCSGVSGLNRNCKDTEQQQH